MDSLNGMVVLLADCQCLGIALVRLPLGDTRFSGDLLVGESVTFLRFEDQGKAAITQALLRGRLFIFRG